MAAWHYDPRCFITGTLANLGAWQRHMERNVLDKQLGTGTAGKANRLLYKSTPHSVWQLKNKCEYLI